MHKMLTALLLGATIATPALAQDRGPGDGRPARADMRRDGGPATTRLDDGPGRDRGDRGDRGVRGDAGRFDRGDRRGAQDDGRFAGRGDDRRGPGNDGRPDRDGRFDGNGRDGRFDGRQDGRPGWNGNGGGGNWRDGRDGRFVNNRGDARWQGGAGSWNRDWRGDSRYDWRSYRRGNDRTFRAPRYYGPQGYDRGYRRWSTGYRVQPAYYGQNYWISRPDLYRLPPAYGGYRWVRYYDDVALVDIRSGLIADILYSFFL